MRNKFFFGVFVVVVVLFFVFFVFPRVQAQVKAVESPIHLRAGIIKVADVTDVKQLKANDVDVIPVNDDTVSVVGKDTVAQNVGKMVRGQVVVHDGIEQVQVVVTDVTDSI